MSYRLDTIEPTLTSKLAMLSGSQQRAIALAICKQLIEVLQITDSVAKIAITDLSKGLNLSNQIRHDLNISSKRYDESYFLKQENGDNEEAILYFSKARILSALSFAGMEDIYLGSVESIYEATMAVDDQKVLIDLVNGYLDG